MPSSQASKRSTRKYFRYFPPAPQLRQCFLQYGLNRNRFKTLVVRAARVLSVVNGNTRAAGKFAIENSLPVAEGAIQAWGLRAEKHDRRKIEKCGEMRRTAVAGDHHTRNRVEGQQLAKACPAGEVDATGVANEFQYMSSIFPLRCHARDHDAGIGNRV